MSLSFKVHLKNEDCINFVYYINFIDDGCEYIIEGFVLNFYVFIPSKSHISCQSNDNDGSSNTDPTKIKMAISKIAEIAKTIISKGSSEMAKIMQKLGSKS